MYRIKDHITCVIGPGMVGNDLSRTADHNTTHEAFDPDLAVAKGHRHRIVIAAITHHRCRRHLAAL